MKRRNEIDIFADVLKVAMVGAKKTWIIYQANLNNKIVKRYLSKLMEWGFLVFHDRMYSTTERGFEFLERYNDLTSIMEVDFLTIDQTVEVSDVVR